MEMVFDIVEFGGNVAWRGKRLNRPDRKNGVSAKYSRFLEKREAGIKNEMAFALIETGRYTRVER